LSNGLCVSPLKAQSDGQAPQPRSLRDVVYQIDNDRDFKTYVMSFSSKVGPKPAEIKYERHPVSTCSATSGVKLTIHLDPSKSANNTTYASSIATAAKSASLPSIITQGPGQQSTPPYSQSFNQGYPQGSQQPAEGIQRLFATASSSRRLRWCPQLPPHQFSSAPSPQSPQQFHNNAAQSADLPPLRPVFGISLDELFARDGSAVPLVVYQCVQAVDLFGGSRRHLSAFRHGFTRLEDQSHVRQR
jgi:hypothetical protein